MLKKWLLTGLMALGFAWQASAQTCEWLNIEGGSGQEDIWATTTDTKNDVIICGGYQDSFSIGSYHLPKPAQHNAFLVKYNTHGNLKWVVNSVQTQSGFCWFWKCITDKNNSIYVLANAKGTIDFGNNVTISTLGSEVIVKYDENGKALWCLEIIGGGGLYLTVDYDNNLLIAFTVTGQVSFTGLSNTYSHHWSKGTDIAIAKFTPSREFINITSFGGVGSEQPTGLGCDENNNIYITGYSSSSLNAYVFGKDLIDGRGEVILKLDSALTPIKGKITATQKMGLFPGSAVVVQKNGKFAVTGYVHDTVRYGNGIFLASPWSYQAGGNDVASIVYYDSTLAPLWARQNDSLSDTTVVNPWAGIQLRNNNIYIGGSLYYGKTKFGSHILNYLGAGWQSQFFVVKIDTLGNFLWAFSDEDSTGVNFTKVWGITVDNEGNPIIAGQFSNKITVFNVSKRGNTPIQDIFTAKIADYEIWRGKVSAGPYCAGDTLKVPYTKKGVYKPGNQFIAQLSDSAGNFEGGERELGRVTDTSHGTINGQLPLFNVATNNKYRIRIMSTNPSVQSYYKIDTLRLLIYSKDTANAGSDTLICKGQRIRLGTTGGSRWNWSPATALLNPGDSANRQPLVSPDTTVKFRIIISDTSGCGEIDTDYVVVHIRPAIDAQIMGDSIICRGNQQTLKVKVKGGVEKNYWYKWKIVGLNIIQSTSDSLVVKPLATNKFMVAVGDSCSSKIDTAYFTVHVGTVLNALTSADTVVCKGATATLQANGIGCTPRFYKYQWRVAGNANIISQQSAITVLPDSTTIYVVTVQDTSANISDTASVTVTVRPPLKVTVNPDTTICLGQTAELRAVTLGGDSVNHFVFWVANSGAYTFGKKVTAAPSQTTVYWAYLSDGCTSEIDSAEITVNVRPPLKVTVNADTTICLGENAELRAIDSGGHAPARSVVWSEVGGQTTVNGPQTTVKPTKTTTYRAVLTDGCTVLGDSAEITVTVRPPLKVTVNADTTICIGQSGEIRANLSGGYAPSHSMLWTADSGPWTNINARVGVSPTTTTTYRAVLSDGCTTPSDSAEITVTVRPPLSIKASAKDSICSNQILVLNSTIAGGYTPSHSIQWTYDHGLLTTDPNPTDTPKITTTYIVRLRDNCSPDVYDTLKVIVLPVPKADFGVLPFEGCPPLSVNFTDLSTGNDTVLNKWKIQSNEVLGVKEYLHEFVKPGKYGIGLTTSNALGCVDYIFKPNAVTVFDKPQAQFIAKPDIKEIENPVFLYNQSRRADSYTWDMGDGYSFNQNTNSDTLYSYTDTGAMVIKLIAQNEKGCLDTQEQLIHIHDKINCVIPSAFTPNGDGINNTFSPVCVGVATYHITIYNRWGQAILDCDDCSWDGTYNGYAVPPGVYLYKLKLKAHSNKEGTSFGTVQVLR